MYKTLSTVPDMRGDSVTRPDRKAWRAPSTCVTRNRVPQIRRLKPQPPDLSMGLCLEVGL